MKKIFALLIILILSQIAVQSENTYSENWVQVAENNYLEMNGIVGLEDRYGYSFLIKAYNKGQFEPINNKPVMYTLAQYKLDCGQKKYKIGVIDSYGYKNNFLNGDYNKYSQYRSIPSGTTIDAVSKKLCRPL